MRRLNAKQLFSVPQGITGMQVRTVLIGSRAGVRPYRPGTMRSACIGTGQIRTITWVKAAGQKLGIMFR